MSVTAQSLNATADELQVKRDELVDDPANTNTSLQLALVEAAVALRRVSVMISNVESAGGAADRTPGYDRDEFLRSLKDGEGPDDTDRDGRETPHPEVAAAAAQRDAANREGAAE